jgi:hypothetical protein
VAFWHAQQVALSAALSLAEKALGICVSSLREYTRGFPLPGHDIWAPATGSHQAFVGLVMAGLASRGRAKAGGDYDAGSITSNRSST